MAIKMTIALIYLFTGLLIGGIVSWLFGNILKISRSRFNELDKQKSLVEERLNFLKTDFHKLDEAFKSKEFHEIDLRDSLIAAQSEIKSLREKLKDQKDATENMHRQLSVQFENLANNILNKNSEQFSRTNQEKIGLILNPLKEKIFSFERKVEEVYKSHAVESSVLKEEIKKLAHLNQQMSEDAKNLTMALKGDNKIQGNWGEVVLERILERSGLSEGSEYILQGKNMSLKCENGRTQKPDVIILLPDEKHIVIDAKASLKAYESLISADTPAEKEQYMKHHITSIKGHINNLSEKYYQSLHKLNTPDFVLLFLPVEASFSIALQGGNDDLFHFAWERKVVIVSPTTLLATLRTIASIWKNEKQNCNALKIAEESGKLYDKFHAFVSDMEKIGKSIQQSNVAYDDAMKKLCEGKGNLLNKAEKLKEMGINSKKSLGELYEVKNKLAGSR